MSIDPLQFGALPPVAGAKAGGTKITGTGQADFAQLLERLRQAAPEAKTAAAQAEALLTFTRMQLQQGLFAEEQDADSSDELMTLLRPDFSLRPQAPPAQADRLYRQLQPRLELQPPGRSEVEQMIDQVAGQVSLAPELIRSVVAAESDFQVQAVSSAGAQGLMQLMPETAAELGVEDRFDPRQNLLGGSRYLKQLLEKYEGDLDKTLAAYNWGQGNVDRKGLAQMPQETRDYLLKVKGLLAGNG